MDLISFLFLCVRTKFLFLCAYALSSSCTNVLLVVCTYVHVFSCNTFLYACRYFLYMYAQIAFMLWTVPIFFLCICIPFFLYVRTYFHLVISVCTFNNDKNADINNFPWFRARHCTHPESAIFFYIMLKQFARTKLQKWRESNSDLYISHSDKLRRFLPPALSSSYFGLNLLLIRYSIKIFLFRT